MKRGKRKKDCSGIPLLCAMFHWPQDAGHSFSHKGVIGEPHWCHDLTWLMNPGQFFRMFSFLFFFYSWRYSFGPCFFLMSFFLFPGSYLTSSFSLLSPFIQFISKVDKTGRCNGNQWQWENKRGYYLGSGKCFFFSFFRCFRCFNPSNWLDGVLAFLFRFVLFIILYPLLILVGKQTVPVVLK